MKFLMMVFALGLATVACDALPNVNLFAPTAFTGNTAVETQAATPTPKRARRVTPDVPTSTPAPFATPLPPPPPTPPPKIMHQLAGHTECLSCHRKGEINLPSDHLRRSEKTCLGCHVVDYDAVKVEAPAFSHSTNDTDCLRCHLWGKDGAGAIPVEHVERPNETCLNCHVQK